MSVFLRLIYRFNVIMVEILMGFFMEVNKLILKFVGRTLWRHFQRKRAAESCPIRCYSVAQLCPTLCDLMDCNTPGFPVLHHLPEFTQTHVHWIGDAPSERKTYHKAMLFAFFPVLLECEVKWIESHSVMSNSLWPHGLYSPLNSLGQNTGVGGYSLLQGIFPTQGSNPGLPHCRRILYQLNTRQAFIGVSLTKKVMYLKCTMWWFDI